MARGRSSSDTINPYITLSDVLFNLVLIFVLTSVVIGIASQVNSEQLRESLNRVRELQASALALAQERDTIREQASSLQQHVSQLSTQIDQTSRDLRSSQQQLEWLQRLNERLASQNQSLQTESADALRDAEAVTALRDQFAAENARLLADNVELAQLRDALVAQNETLSERVDNAVARTLDLRQQLARTEQDLAQTNSARAELARINVALDPDLATLITSLQTDLETARARIEALQRKNFLAVKLEWESLHDLDLYVIDPEGRTFYWDVETYSSSGARLTLDNTRGGSADNPAVEAWIARELIPGTYIIKVGLYGCNGTPICDTGTQARVTIDYRDNARSVQTSLNASDTYATAYYQVSQRDSSREQRLEAVANIQRALVTVAQVRVDGKGFITLE